MDNFKDDGVAPSVNQANANNIFINTETIILSTKSIIMRINYNFTKRLASLLVMLGFVHFTFGQTVLTENFDATTAGGTACTSVCAAPTGWTNDTGDDKDWSAKSGQTGSLDTGPSGDHTSGSGKYMYTEASGCYSKTAYLTSPTLNFSSYTGMVMQFYYHMYGSSMGSLSVEVSTDNGSTWNTTPAWTISGQQHTSLTDPWTMATVNLNAYTGTGMSQVKVRFKGVTGTNYYSDMAIDDVSIYAPAPMVYVSSTATQADTSDAKAGGLNQLVIGMEIVTSGLLSPFDVTQFALSTNGSSNATTDIDSARIYYTGGNSSFSTSNYFGSAVSPSGSFTVSGTQTLTMGTNYFWLVYDIDPNATVGNVIDGEFTSVTLSGTTGTKTPTITAPSGTRTLALKAAIGNGGTSQYYLPAYGFYDYSWSAQIYKAAEIGINGKISALSFNVVNAVSNYTMINQKIYMAITPDTAFADGSYISPASIGATLVYDGTVSWNSGMNTITLQNQFTYTGGNLILLYENYDGSYSSGYPQFSAHTVSGLSKYKYADGSFPATSGTTPGYRSDIIINMLPLVANDLGILSWVSPIGGTTPSATMPISIDVFNYGTQPQDTFVLSYSVDGGQTIVTETYNDTIAPLDTLHYTFTATANMATAGYYNVGAAVYNVGDSYAPNDSLFAQYYLCAALSGTYTIGTDSTDDFNTFADAIFALENCGVAGPVVFNVDSGMYNEQITIGAITGASAANTVIFTAANHDSTSVVIDYAPTGTSNNWTVKLDGAMYVNFKHLTITTSGSSYGRVVELVNGASYNRIENCVIQSSLTSTSSNFAGIYSNSSIDNYNYIGFNLIKGGYYSVYFRGVSTTGWKKGNVFESNTVSDFYLYGMYLYYNDSVQVLGNNISGNRNTYGYGIYNSYSNNVYNVAGNTVVITGNSSSSCYGIYNYYNNYYSYNSTPSGFGMVYNNMISIIGGTGSHYGIYDYYSRGTGIYHNSINITDGSTSSRCAYQSNTTSNTDGSKYLNNSFVNSGGSGYAAYFNTPTMVDSVDYNNYYTTGTNFVYWSGNKTDLAALQTANSADANSVSMNPGYMSVSDLHTNLIPFNNLGTPISAVTTDIDGDARDASTPDIGADEFTPPANDVAVIEWVAPMTGINLNPAVTITVKIANFGTANQSNVPVKYSIDGGATYVSEVIAGPIVSQDTISYTFNTAANFNTFGLYNSGAFVDLTNDQNRMNDTIFYDIYACNPFSGSYTIGQGSGFDFASFTDAVNALNSCGVSGPVTLVAANDTFNEQFTIGSIPGASALNTITLKGSGNTTIWYESTNSSKRAIIELDGAKYVTLDSLNIISGPNATYGWGIHLWHSADSNTIQNCHIELQNSGSSTGFNGIVASNSNTTYGSNGANAYYLTLDNNMIIGGYYGVILRGESSSASGLAPGTKIMNNTLEGYTYYGLYLYYHDAPEVIGNTLNQTYSKCLLSHVLVLL
jgi:parallel beta-helix repeat protein